jgi:hypothetical protein
MELEHVFAKFLVEHGLHRNTMCARRVKGTGGLVILFLPRLERFPTAALAHDSPAGAFLLEVPIQLALGPGKLTFTLLRTEARDVFSRVEGHEHLVLAVYILRGGHKLAGIDGSVTNQALAERDAVRRGHVELEVVAGARKTHADNLVALVLQRLYPSRGGARKTRQLYWDPDQLMTDDTWNHYFGNIFFLPDRGFQFFLFILYFYTHKKMSGSSEILFFIFL